MKRIILTFISLGLYCFAMAQSKDATISIKTDTINNTSTYRIGGFSVKIGQDIKVETESEDNLYVLPGQNIIISRSRCENEPHFNGHWASFQMGVNGFANANYGSYAPSSDLPKEFMQLNQAVSWEVNLNFFEKSFALNKNKNLGIVTGLGISWNNYKFDNSITIDTDKDGRVYPIDISENNFRKSKLTLSYLTLPLMLEYQFKANGGSNKLFVSGGVVGALNLGSHTKVKNDHQKNKDKGSFSVAPFKYSGIFQIGGNNLSLYATYSFSELFRNGTGPSLAPFSIGFSLINF